jgi:chemotaxis protein MotB
MERRPPVEDEPWLLSYADLITNLLVFFVMLLTAAELSPTKMQAIQKQLSGVEQPQSLAAIQKEIDERIEAEGLQELISTKLTDDGLKLSLNSGVVFDSGKAGIKNAITPVLDSMLGALAPYAQKYNFAVEGHTDSRPISGGAFASNWELSTARANAVRQRLEGAGVPAGTIRVEGYADTKPLPAVLLEGLSEDEKLARHRRVVLRIY